MIFHNQHYHYHLIRSPRWIIWTQSPALNRFQVNPGNRQLDLTGVSLLDSSVIPMFETQPYIYIYIYITDGFT